jgi:hypothetical protein
LSALQPWRWVGIFFRIGWELVIAAEKYPFQLFRQFLAARAPRHGFDDDLLAVPFDMVPKKLIGVLGSRVYFARATASRLRGATAPRARRYAV